MYALTNLKSKNEGESDISYTLVSSESSRSKTEKLKPSRWNTVEFYVYYIVHVVTIPYMFWVAYTISRESHPNYPQYEYYLSDGWLFGRKIDNSDFQFASVRNNYIPLFLALVIHVALSRLYRFLFVPSQPAKLPSQHLHQVYFNLVFSLLFFYGLCGNGLLKILIILTMNYLIAKVFKGSILNCVITWVFNLAILFLNDRYKGYEFAMVDERLSFLDDNRGLLRWQVTFNISMLRMISYNMDYYWSFGKLAGDDSKEVILGDLDRNDRDKAPLTEKDRINAPCYKEDYNYIYYLSYILYAPLYLAGPIITYNNFISQLRYPCRPSFKSVSLYGIRLVGSMLLMEFMLHYMYVVAIAKAHAWQGDSPIELGMIAYFNLKLIWLKLLIIWRFFRFWAMADGFQVDENMLRCASNVYSIRSFWRMWHRSYNRWTIRYIYIPLGGTKYAMYNIWVVFTFVALWHDISLKLLTWGWLISLFILPELIVTSLFTEKKFGDKPYYRHVCACGAVLNLLFMVFANLVGFVVGLDGVWDILKLIFMTVEGVQFFVLSFMALFTATQIMFEIREEEKRRNIDRNRS